MNAPRRNGLGTDAHLSRSVCTAMDAASAVLGPFPLVLPRDVERVGEIPQLVFRSHLSNPIKVQRRACMGINWKNT